MTMLTMPSPPAFATAAASSGVATPPMPACWIGTRQPTRSVKAVDSIASAPPISELASTLPLKIPIPGHP